MQKKARTQSPDPISASPAAQPSLVSDPRMDTEAHSVPKMKRCVDCCAMLPIEAYGFFKYTKDRTAPKCKECRAQYQRLQRKFKYGARGNPNIDDNHIRCLDLHNEILLDEVLASSKMELRGFDVVNKMELKVFHGPSDRHGMMSFAMFTRNGMVYREYSYSGENNPKATIKSILNALNIRLELDDAHVVASKILIYYV